MDVCVVFVVWTVVWKVKVTWRAKGFKQYKNGSKGRKPRTGKKKIPPGAWSLCCVCCIRTVAWNVKWHEGRKDLNSTKMNQREENPGHKNKSHRGHGCLCCVCCIRTVVWNVKVTWRTKGFKQYKNGSKGKKPGQAKKKSWEEQKYFFSKKSSDPLWGPPSLVFNGYRCSFPRLKLPKREADHSPPSSAQVKNNGAIPPLALYAFMVWTVTFVCYPVCINRPRMHTKHINPEATKDQYAPTKHHLVTSHVTIRIIMKFRIRRKKRNFLTSPTAITLSRRL
jgi:hypothetical protein